MAYFKQVLACQDIRLPKKKTAFLLPLFSRSWSKWQDPVEIKYPKKKKKNENKYTIRLIDFGMGKGKILRAFSLPLT